MKPQRLIGRIFNFALSGPAWGSKYLCLESRLYEWQMASRFRRRKLIFRYNKFSTGFTPLYTHTEIFSASALVFSQGLAPTGQLFKTSSFGRPTASFRNERPSFQIRLAILRIRLTTCLYRMWTKSISLSAHFTSISQPSAARCIWNIRGLPIGQNIAS